MSEDVLINDHELCRRILSNIYHLRNNLKELEKFNPGLFELLDENDTLVSSHWEFWTTDEILEIIGSELGDALKVSEDIQNKQLYKKLYEGL